MAEQPLPGGTQRAKKRKKRRIPCQVWVGEREHSALVLDLSASGLFIQTRAKAEIGERLHLRLSHENTAVDLKVEVVRMKNVPQDLLAAAKGGIGVQILNAPPEYDALMNELGIAESDAKPTIQCAPELESRPRFRVHAAHAGGPRSRRVEVSAADPDAASALALEELGDGWKVLRVEAL
jgi:Tfp pilus assembly protein PilZ